MISKRQWSSTLDLHQSVFIFSGNYKVKECEIFSLDKRSFNPLENIIEWTQFFGINNFNQNIFIIGGSGSFGNKDKIYIYNIG